MLAQHWQALVLASGGLPSVATHAWLSAPLPLLSLLCIQAHKAGLTNSWHREEKGFFKILAKRCQNLSLGSIRTMCPLCFPTMPEPVAHHL